MVENGNWASSKVGLDGTDPGTNSGASGGGWEILHVWSCTYKFHMYYVVGTYTSSTSHDKRLRSELPLVECNKCGWKPQGVGVQDEVRQSTSVRITRFGFVSAFVWVLSTFVIFNRSSCFGVLSVDGSQGQFSYWEEEYVDMLKWCLKRLRLHLCMERWIRRIPRMKISRRICLF